MLGTPLSTLSLFVLIHCLNPLQFSYRMKIQCNVCESAEATMLCCADEAALCWNCDDKIHAANKLASKHQRIPLSNSNKQMPKCDICQESDGYFFCLEDRALLCRKCDVAIHTVNSAVSSHQRFLLTGVKMGHETSDLVSSSSVKFPPYEKTPQTPESICLPTCVPMSTNTQYDKVLPGDFSSPKLSYGGGSTDSIQQWQFDDFFGLTDINQNYNYLDDSSKADSSKMGGWDCSLMLRALEVELDSDECLGQVPDSSRAVPQICSPPTASGLSWSNQEHRHHYNHVAFVPDVYYNPLSNSHYSQQTLKRRRHF
ncbi:hypothetical protein LXL04_001908 [Taraxacum kok-saghyz]